MPTITSYFGFLLAALTITSALFIGLSKIRLIWISYLKWTIPKKKSLCGISYIRELLTVSILGHWDSWQFGLIFRYRYYLFFSFQTNWNDWSFSIWNRVRSNSYYFGWIIRSCIFTIQTWWSVGPLIN